MTSGNGVEVVVGGPRVRALLALLTLDVGHRLTDARLIGDIWDETPPHDTANALQSLVRRLRSALPSAVARESGGYALTLDPEMTDVHRFTTALTRGRRQLIAGHADQAATSLDAALAEWRGAPLSDVGESSRLHTVAQGLAEQRLLAIELRADAYRHLGRSTEILCELTRESTEHPFRETLAARLISALSAAGRHAEALRTFEQIQQQLHTELGVTASPLLREALTETPAPPKPTAAPEPPAVIDSPTANGSRVDTAPAHPVVPRRFTSFIGRGSDLAALTRTLGSSRLVTLIGAGGVGKTRLAAEMVETHTSDWPDGSVFVELAAIDRTEPGRTDPPIIGLAILTAFGQSERGMDANADWLEVLCRSLGGRRMLLVLDNCEHVVATAAEMIATLLRRLPLLTVLTTSREALGVDGERLHPVSALTVPEAGASAAEAANFAAVQLFIDRAVAARSDFLLTDDNCARVCALVRDLDGLPLAIELAAARLRALALDEVAARIADRFSVLTSTVRHAVPRHRTMQAAVRWSWELLSEPEAELARRFSVFAGGATLDTIIRVHGANSVEALASLVIKSLIEFDGERYRMAETVRAYATSQLDASGESDAVSGAFTDHFIDFTTTATSTAGLLSPDHYQWLRRLSAEHGNCEAALRWSIRSGDGERALRLYGNLLWFWLLSGFHGFISGYRHDVLTLVGEQPPTECTAAFLACQYAERLPVRSMGISWTEICFEPYDFEQLMRTAMTEADPPHPVFILILALRLSTDGDDTLLAECAAGENGWLRGNTLLIQSLDALERGKARSGLSTLRAAADDLSKFGCPRSRSRLLVTLATYHARTAGLDTATPIIEYAISLLVGEADCAEPAQFTDPCRSLEETHHGVTDIPARVTELLDPLGDPPIQLPVTPDGAAPPIDRRHRLYAAALPDAFLLDKAANESAHDQNPTRAIPPIELAEVAVGRAVREIAH
ncbi:BTAD domain-containing putative transcriptional regulator [Nocardia heshunensis]